jgi:hypothetical protein
LISGGCSAEGSDAQTVYVENEETIAVPWEEYRDSALAAGHGRFYLVEGDLPFRTETDLRAYYDQAMSEETSKLVIIQRYPTGYEPVYEGADALDIVYCVSNLFPNKTTVVNDMAKATRGWEKVANVDFRYDSTQDATCDWDNTEVDFAVMLTDVAGLRGCASNKMLWIADCPIPLGNGDYRFEKGVLVVNYSLIPGPPPWDALTPAGIMRHELGHILGFRHEHPFNPEAEGACEAQTSEILELTGSPLTPYDQISVMHYKHCNGVAGTDYVVSALDGVGARIVYGMPAAWHVALFP